MKSALKFFILTLVTHTTCNNAPVHQATAQPNQTIIPTVPEEVDYGPAIAYITFKDVIGNLAKIPVDKQNPQHVSNCVGGIVEGIAKMIYFASRSPQTITPQEIMCQYFATEDGQQLLNYILQSPSGQTILLNFLDTETGTEIIARHRSRIEQHQ